MPIVTEMTNSYKVDLFKSVHNHSVAGGNAFHMALYTDQANLDKTTTSYTGTTNEVTEAGTNYTTGGQAMVNIEPALDGDTAHTQFQNVTWPSSSITARGCLIYNNTAVGKNSVSAHDFGQNYTSSNGDFTVLMPTNNGTTGLLRLI